MLPSETNYSSSDKRYNMLRSCYSDILFIYFLISSLLRGLVWAFLLWSCSGAMDMSGVALPLP